MWGREGGCSWRSAHLLRPPCKQTSRTEHCQAVHTVGVGSPHNLETVVPAVQLADACWCCPLCPAEPLTGDGLDLMGYVEFQRSYR